MKAHGVCHAQHTAHTNETHPVTCDTQSTLTGKPVSSSLLSLVSNQCFMQLLAELS